MFIEGDRKLGTFLLIKIECGPKGCKNTNKITVRPRQKWMCQSYMAQTKKDNLHIIIGSKNYIDNVQYAIILFQLNFKVITLVFSYKLAKRIVQVSIWIM